jgi:uncharacterized protein (TIGR02444 family)
MPLDNPFWQFSIRVYAAPGVAEECLALQERYDIDVDLLLFCVWLAVERGIDITPADVAVFNDAVGEWHRRTVKPLRAARQAMKGLAGAEAMRAQVKALELEAEHMEQRMLFDLAAKRWPQPATTVRVSPTHNLSVFLAAHGAIGAEAAPMLIRSLGTD